MSRQGRPSTAALRGPISAMNPSEPSWAALQRARRMTWLERFDDQRLTSERSERRRPAKIGPRALRCMQERVIGGECGDGIVAAGEQPMDALVERQIGAGALGRDH